VQDAQHIGVTRGINAQQFFPKLVIGQMLPGTNNDPKTVLQEKCHPLLHEIPFPWEIDVIKPVIHNELTGEEICRFLQMDLGRIVVWIDGIGPELYLNVRVCFPYVPEGPIELFGEQFVAQQVPAPAPAV
jgi:hypothetical protein